MTSMKDKEILPRDILIVDDEVPNLKLLTKLLSQQGYQVRQAERSQLAIDSALAQPPTLILLDVKMPEMDGFEVCKHLKKDERTKDIPIIFISAPQEAQDRVLGFEAGGVDFISKPFQEKEVLARVRTHIDLRNMQMNLEWIVAERTAQIIESETRFRATFEQAAVGIAYVSIEGRFLRAPLPLKATKVSLSTDIWDGVVGIRGFYNLSDRWFVPYRVDIGTGDSEFTWHAFAGIGYRFDSFKLLLAYRYLEWEFEDGEVLDDLQVSGPAIGALFTF